MSDPGTVEGLRSEISALWEKRARGDVSERAFQKESERIVLDLCRGLVRARVGQSEEILLEHHVVRAHTKIAGSVLRESEQEFISLLATDRRLFRLRALLHPNQPLLFRDKAQDTLEEMDLKSVSEVVIQRQRRTGEIVAGLAIAGLAILTHSWLQITGTALFLLGIAGALHGLAPSDPLGRGAERFGRGSHVLRDLGPSKKEWAQTCPVLAPEDHRRVK